MAPYSSGKKDIQGTPFQRGGPKRRHKCFNGSNHVSKSFQLQSEISVYCNCLLYGPRHLAIHGKLTSPTPLTIICCHFNTTCTVSLFWQHCEEVRTWEQHCQSYYSKEQIWTSIRLTEENTRQMDKPGVLKPYWGMDCPWGRSHGKTVTFVADPLIILAEGHAFRKSLCDGKEIHGSKWLQPTQLDSYMTCHWSKGT